MKTKIHYILLVVAVSLFSSCEDWLNVSSSTQVKADDLFDSESGFQEALTGIYLNMASTDLYAKNLSWHFIDLLGQPYEQPQSSSNDAYYIKNYAYTSSNVEGYIDAIWSKAYNTIANINNELKYVDANASVVNAVSRNLYKGELLALRAYLHLDLMRIFGYGDLHDRTDYDTRLTIPYVTVYSKDLTDQLPYKETMALVIKDIKDALSNLSDDPIRGLHGSDYYEEINADGYWNNRNKRMNYFAAEALLARAYMWEGSPESVDTAYTIAKSLTELEGTAYNWVTYSDISSSDVDYIDRTFSSEHLFSLDAYDLLGTVNSYIVDPANSYGNNTNYMSEKGVEESIFDAKYYGVGGYFYAPNDTAADATGIINLSIPDGASFVSGDGINDYRFNLHYKGSTVNGENVYYSYKLYQPADYSSSYKNRIPLIKISEMYYIMAEYYLQHNDEASALEVLNTVRKHRGLENDINTDRMISVQSELNKEYMREFIGEGQLFFYFKRLNIEDPSYYEASSGYAGIENFSFDDTKFLLPYPTDEVTYGNRVQ